MKRAADSFVLLFLGLVMVGVGISALGGHAGVVIGATIQGFAAGLAAGAFLWRRR